MNIKSAQKKILVRLVVYFVIITGLVAICVYLGGVDTKVEEKHDWLKNDISSLSRKIDGLSKKALEFSDAVNTWEGFDAEKKSLQGLRISYAKDIIDRVAAKNKLTGLKVTFSKPEELTKKESEDLFSDTVGVISSTVSIDFLGITDEYIMEFIASLMKEFPGYIQVKSFSLTRSKVVNKEVLEKIASGDFTGLVDAKLTFIWRDLKYKEPSSGEGDNS